MAGTPRFFLASIALPADTEKAYVYDVYRGLRDCAREFACPLVGGNTSRLPGRIMISTTVLGEAAKGSIVYRTGASPGDGVFVTGTTGDSALGLKVLAEYGEKALRGRFRRAVLKHLDPAPRLSLAKALAQRAGVSSMIDVSDGFLLDLKRLCRSSRVSAVVKGALMPVSDELRAYYGRGRKAVETLVLTGGEDYELIFTAPKGRSREIARVSKGFGVRITEVGEIVRVQKKAVRVFGNNGAELGFRAMGFEHF
jgi:thiamine-monophosphate kinase